jgi:bleomycin hydrolase
MKLRIIILIVYVFILSPAYAQKAKSAGKDAAASGYKFTRVVDLKATSVKDQASTGTCWCFATTSFIESELLRMGRGEYDLSEMWLVRNNYYDRLRDNFVQKGKGNLGQGSVGHDWMLEFVENGIVPEEVYTGLNYGLSFHNHGELNAMVNAIAPVALRRQKESEQYLQVADAILDIYFGRCPSSFNYRGVGYTPKSFSETLGLNPEDYVEITSFTLFPFYTKGIVPIPDNWRKMSYYNVPLDELIQIMDYSLENGYTVSWDGDVSEKGFSHPDGVAIIPELEKTDLYSKTDAERLGKMTKEQLEKEAYKFSSPFPEVKVTQESRQEGFDTKKTTDDHLMHLTGIAKDQNGTKYYVTKNSWGTDRNPFGGYLNMSESYVRAKTIAIMVHRKAIPDGIRTKLGIN